jgi:hypothetical protein
MKIARHLLQLVSKIELSTFTIFCIMMLFYRVISHIDGVSNSSIEYQTLAEAYKKCIPSDESEACRRLLNGVQSEIQKGERFIRVTCSRGNTWWIQLVNNANEPVRSISEAASKIDCCHAHQ